MRHGRVLAAVGAHLQVLVHRQTEHDLPSFRHEREVPAEAPRRRKISDVFAVETDTPSRHRHQSLQCAKERSLAGAVGAQHRHHLVGADRQRNAFDRMGAAIADVKIVDFK